MRVASYILTFAVGVWLTALYFLTKDGNPPRYVEVFRDIVTTDTVFLRADPYVVRLTDTTTDTLFIPIVQTRFDTLIKTIHIGGTIEGWHTKIDSVFVEVQKFPCERSRWGVGIVAGAGAGIGGITPFLGVGLTYNILEL